MRATEFIFEDLSRRGFIKGLAATAAPFAALTPLKKLSDKTEPEKRKLSIFKPISDQPEIEKYVAQKAQQAGIQGIELAQFMAQLMHESWNFTKLSEKSHGPKYFTRKYDIKYNPRIARTLGNVKSGDGERYHGRGFIQLTGRSNYRRAGKALGIPLEDNPSLASKPDVAAKVAIWYWNERVKPNVTNFHDTAQVTRFINAGLSGLRDRHTKFLNYANVML